MMPEDWPTKATGRAVVETEIYVFPPAESAVSNWEEDARCDLHLTPEGSVFHITANVAGLRSIARHCLTLAQQGQEEAHVDFDCDSGWFETEDFGLRISRAWD